MRPLLDDSSSLHHCSSLIDFLYIDFFYRNDNIGFMYGSSTKALIIDPAIGTAVIWHTNLK